MDLEKLQERLYKEKKTEFEARPEAPKVFEPGQEYLGWKKEEPIGTETKFRLSEKQKKISRLIFFGVGIVVFILAGWFVWRSLSSFDTDKISINIFGPDRIASGEEVNYIVSYKNNTRSDLKNAKITFIFPEDSSPVADENIVMIGGLATITKNLEFLSSGQEGQLEFKANVIGLKNEKKRASVTFEFSPVNVSTSFKKTSEFFSEIFSVPLVLDFDLPERAVNGQTLNFSLKYLNISEAPFYNLVLSLETPPGFTLNSVSPAPTKEKDWVFEEIAPGEEGRILISGILNGSQNETKLFKAKIGYRQGDSLKLISEGLGSAVVLSSPLEVKLSLNDRPDYIANPGDSLQYKITYKNTVDVPIYSVYIIAKLDARVLDIKTLEAGQGFLNNADSSITWNESSLPDLKMLASGEDKIIYFSVRVKDKEKIQVANFKDKDFLISSSVKIDSSNIPVSLAGVPLQGFDQLETKLNSVLAISSRGYFFDNQLSNSGPLPPRVGQETTYTIYWQVVNFFNDTENVVVESYLPPGVRWLGNYEPRDGSLKYDSSAGKISWDLGRVFGGTGNGLYPAKQLIFQIGLTPNSTQIGNVVDLVKEAKISGEDVFTKTDLFNESASVRSDLPYDASVGYSNGKVAP